MGDILRLKAGIVFACAGVLALSLPASTVRAAEPTACENADTIAVLVSPLSPWKGASLRVVVASDRLFDGELALIAPSGDAAATSRERLGGPPYHWFVEFAAPEAGKWQVKLTRSGEGSSCAPMTREVLVKRTEPVSPGAVANSVWPLRGKWDRQAENLYSAWIETLFEAPLEVAPSWPALHEVLRDRSRNLLFNHLGLREDEKKLVFQPDCADLPYFLRGYFAFKMGLPFGYAKCSRGGGGKPPRCPAWWNIQKEESTEITGEEASGFGGIFEAPRATRKVPKRPAGLAQSFAAYLGSTVSNAVHSGSGRTAADDDSTDYYPITLSEETLRPGTVYADPYGHLLVLVKRVPQKEGAAGVFLAVDGQPDGTVARKRFWRGNFLFAQDPALGSPGFKRFRPIAREKGGLRRLTNAEIFKSANYGDFALEQSKLSVEAFYDKMDDVMSPKPLDPKQALTEALTALEEQVKARVTSVENGRKYHLGDGQEVAMPDGASIFETTGAWEDFATPSRDLRLLIAIDVVTGFSERVARRPERYAMPKEAGVADVKRELDELLAKGLAGRSLSYFRTDGSPWTLTLKDVVDRSKSLEMAYNLNDCVELRWGAAEKSEEASTCKRQAPEAQRKKMGEYRPWFSERRRPPRG